MLVFEEGMFFPLFLGSKPFWCFDDLYPHISRLTHVAHASRVFMIVGNHLLQREINGQITLNSGTNVTCHSQKTAVVSKVA